MYLFKKVNDLQKYLNKLRNEGNSIGFVPTMGALHEGHLSLINKAKTETNIVVSSIFVNPTQFNQPEDLLKYPRTTSKDIEVLTSHGNHVLFMPPVEEVYPEGLNTKLDLDFGQLDKTMEGEFRPGHFSGMAQVVNRLANIVEPAKMYFGQKDFQQYAIVRNMLNQLNSSVKAIMCPIIRENDGLALASRNLRLTADNRQRATIIYQTLLNAKSLIRESNSKTVKEIALKQLTIKDFKPEYFEIVDGQSLMPISRFDDSDYIVACTAVWAGDVRLIDSMIFKQQEN
jgi:pantoate--beta-alanine ligase